MGNEKNKETKRVRTSEVNRKAKTNKTKKEKNNNGKKIKFKDKHPRIFTGIKIGIIVLTLLIIIGGGVLVGTFFGFFGNELKIKEENLVVGYENSTVYDADGNLIATLSGGTKRKSISLSDMSEYLPKAFVAIEDERFYSHSGVDIGRTAYATVTYILNGGNSKFGGSTITQQVIKNITQDKERTAFAGIMRKVKEISKAIQVEHYLSKDQILELYLNLIFVGGDDINGVELGAIYYFNKSAKDLSIAECAYMAGINHSPNAYKPFEDYSDEEDPAKAKEEMQEKINNRTKTVLAKMKEVGYIDEEQYNAASKEVDDGLKFEKGESASVTTDISYHTAAAIEQIIDQILAENEGNEDMDREYAEMFLCSSGLKIYTTQKTNIQTRLEEEVVKSAYWKESTYTDPKTKEKVKQNTMPTMVIVDHTTGDIVAAASAIGTKDERTATTKRGYLNIPTEIKKSTGSSMKPLSVIAPGLETGTLTGATVYDDNQTTFAGSDKWTPKNYYIGWKGLMNMRTAIELSANIPHAKAIVDVGVENAIKFCESIGLTLTGNEGPSLALGGLGEGVSVAQMASAYAAIANDGVYNTPTFYTKVTDANDEVLYEPERSSNRVMSEQNAYITQNILTQPVIGGSGTATYCRINGIDVAAKTGTTNGDCDRWLCGFTPYYTGACWVGYENNAKVTLSGNPAGKIWDAVMTDVHKDLENAKFDEPEGIVKKSVCKISGNLATEACGENVYTELFTEDNMPQNVCAGHLNLRICLETGFLATEYCTQVEERLTTAKPEREETTKWTTTNDSYNYPTETCPNHIAPTQPPVTNTNTTTAHVHDYATVLSKTDATCTTAGKREVKCSCGAIKTETISALGHKAGAWITDLEPTPVTAGAKHQICARCGVTIKTEVIPATGTTTEEDKKDEEDNTISGGNTDTEGNGGNQNQGGNGGEENGGEAPTNNTQIPTNTVQ